MKEEIEERLSKVTAQNLILSLSKQIFFVRTAMGPDASVEAVEAEAKRRAERALALRNRFVKEFSFYPIWDNKKEALSFTDPATPWRVVSELLLDKIKTRMWANMPMPRVLPVFLQALKQTGPESDNRILVVRSDPGMGKTHTARLLVEVMSMEDPVIVDCGDTDLNSLLFKAEIDTDNGTSLQDQIDKRLKEKSIGDVAFARLRGLNEVEMPESVKKALERLEELKEDREKDAEWKKDQEKVAEWKKDHTFFSKDEKGNYCINWKDLSTGSQEKIKAVISIMDDVDRLEEISNGNGSGFGIKMVHGPLIEAWKAGRPIILDEIAKAKLGTGNGLQTVLQLLNGEDDSCTVYSEMAGAGADAGSEFVFKREDMGAGFFVIATGNNVEDGPYEAEFTKSFVSRVEPIDLPYPEELDWQHRVCAAMMGVPVSTIHSLFKERDNYDEKLLGDWMMDLREKYAEIEGRAVPDAEVFLLKHWKEALAASKILAVLFDKWSILTDVNREGDKNNLDVNTYPRERQPDFRMAARIWNDVLDIAPRPEREDGPKVDANARLRDFFNPAAEDSGAFNNDNPENPMDYLGSRLVERIREEINARVPREEYPKLHDELVKAANDAGLFSIELHEGAVSEGNQSLEEILNFGEKKQPSVDMDGTFNNVLSTYISTTVVQVSVKTSASDVKVEKRLEPLKP